MKKTLFALLLTALAVNLHAFDLPALNAARLVLNQSMLDYPAPAPAPAPSRAFNNKAAAAKFAVYQVNGLPVAVPSIGCGYNLLIAANPRVTAVAENKLRPAFSAPASAHLVQIQPKSSAELEFAAQNPGMELYSVNNFLPVNAAKLFNQQPNFGGPNCFNAAFTAAGMMQPDKLRHVGNPETNQLLSMYYKKTSASDLRPGDVVIINNGDHGVFYLGAGLVFHKKSYLTHHTYRIALLEQVYAAEPYEWTPSPFDSGLYNGNDTVRSKEAWRPTGAQYQFGPASAVEQAQVQTIVYLTEQIEYQAPRWAFGKYMGYFTERLLENLVSDWGALAKSSNPVLKAYFHKLESLRDQANQSIETELLSSPHAQGNANEILKAVWMPRNDYSRGITQQLMTIYGRSQADLDKVMSAIEKDYDGAPLKHIKGN